MLIDHRNNLKRRSRGSIDIQFAGAKRCENIRQALIFVETGAAEAGILSWSLVSDWKGAVLLPENLHAPIRQMGAVVKASSRQEEARRALEFLAGPQGQKILRSHGLFPPK